MMDPDAQGPPAASLVVRRGRPPSRTAHRAILDAAREQLERADLQHLNLEQVAHAAGVGKGTIYRHWPTREALALEVLVDAVGELATPRERDDTRAELIALVRGAIRALTETALGHVLRALLSELALQPELAAPFHTRVVQLRRREVAAILQRGIARGDIRPDPDLDVATELLLGPIYYRVLFGGGFPPTFAAGIVDGFLQGYAARDGLAPGEEVGRAPGRCTIEKASHGGAGDRESEP
jgi:AcrR family transcriptional regulator